ncbi:hypothetical protein F3Y22_tig00110911pilonHSYRG00086 [Hibiscus syriacus]|uniref:RNase H type-1 domain-containing protein n=1 Tax=Hibiscus syriacus TaxID=106335 RepID=A0A6A2ZF07_HIBSY|nr:hypothetical protein F3Y22_tig00110911pilonHSYRG00086 [Hibiscus syriacus]
MLKGLRQGDLLSSFLFIMVTEVLHLFLEKASTTGFIEGIDNAAASFGLSINFKKSCLASVGVEDSMLEELASAYDCAVISKFRLIEEDLGVGEWLDIQWGSMLARPLLEREVHTLQEVKNHILSVKCKSGVSDRIVWIHENTANFLVKKLSDLIVNSGTEEVASCVSTQAAVWFPPNLEQVKFNVDGAASIEAAGCGGVLRTPTGTVVALFSGLMSCLGADYAELIVVKTTFEVFRETDWFEKAELIIESNSQVVLNLISSTFLRPW